MIFATKTYFFDVGWGRRRGTWTWPDIAGLWPALAGQKPALASQKPALAGLLAGLLPEKVEKRVDPETKIEKVVSRTSLFEQNC